MKESISFCGATDLGKIRTNNEDAFVVQTIWDDNHILAVVIDGVGGYEGGEVAAELAQKHIVEYLNNYSDGDRLELIKEAVVHANNIIFEERKINRQYSNMSCVLTAALIEVQERRINMAHVGDTRLYQYANDTLTKLSHDHSLVGYREEIGELSEIEAMRHPQRNVIGRDIGSVRLDNNRNDYIEVAEFPLIAKSTLLLCSDGLCDMLTSGEICSVLKTDCGLDDKANALIQAANKAGGKDNITVVLVDFNLDEVSIRASFIEKESLFESKGIDSKPKQQRDSKKKTWAFVLLTVIIALSAGLGGFWLGGGFQTQYAEAQTDVSATQRLDDANAGTISDKDSLLRALEEENENLSKKNEDILKLYLLKEEENKSLQNEMEELKKNN